MSLNINIVVNLGNKTCMIGPTLFAQYYQWSREGGANTICTCHCQVPLSGAILSIEHNLPQNLDLEVVAVVPS